MSDQAVLYDVPGPRARRVTLIVSVVAVAVVAAAVYFFVYRPLDERGQFTMDLWGPLVDPGNAEFSPVWERILKGFQATLIAAAIAIVTSMIIGTLLAILRLQLKALIKRRFAGSPAALPLRVLARGFSALVRVYVEVFRGIPVVITIFFVWVILPKYGLDFDNLLWYLVIGLTIYNSVVIGEILRSGMEGLPSGQREASEAIGLSPFQTTWLVLLPQAFRIMLPALIGQVVVVLKDTSLGSIISYEEALRTATLVAPVVENPNMLQMYAVIAVIYIMLNYSVSRVATYAQKRLARGRKTGGLPPQAMPAAEAGAV